MEGTSITGTARGTASPEPQQHRPRAAINVSGFDLEDGAEPRVSLSRGNPYRLPVSPTVHEAGNG